MSALRLSAFLQCLSLNSTDNYGLYILYLYLKHIRSSACMRGFSVIRNIQSYSQFSYEQIFPAYFYSVWIISHNSNMLVIVHRKSYQCSLSSRKITTYLLLMIICSHWCQKFFIFFYLSFFKSQIFLKS